MTRTRRSFTAAFKADAVALVQQQGYTVARYIVSTILTPGLRT